MPLRVALFVEGSFGIPNRALIAPQRALWCDTIAPLLGLPAPDDVIPISKSHISGMYRHHERDARRPAISGSGEPLDALMQRWMKLNPFDVAIVAWDLEPPLDRRIETCRWRETLELYRLLALSPHLPQEWKEQAQQRHEELANRPYPGARTRLPPVAPGIVLPLCMEPMFEGLFADEKALRRALRMHGVPSRAWPVQWDRRRIDRSLVGPAIEAARAERIKLPVRGGFQQSKDEWGAYLFRTILADPEYGPELARHAIVQRLRELLLPR